MKFAVFNHAGDVIRAGSCPAEALEVQAQPGETVIEWTKDGGPLGWMLVDGELVEA